MIVATAGHIDHGKTALVRALTGVDTDRLPEEKKRGISIDLGFAYRLGAGGASLGFVDVPGHERLVRTMLAGATGVDFVILVIAADDGIMPQTREHLAILDLLGIRRGLVAVTKTDRVDAARVQGVVADATALVDGTVLADAPIFPVSALRGDGMADLAACLDAAAAEPVGVVGGGRFRLAVDRAFTLPGIGLVVTGVVHAGRVTAGDRLVLAPQGREVRVRSLRVDDAVADFGSRGQRCALAISGPRVEKADVSRGDWIVAPEIAAPTSRIDVRLRLLPSATKALRHWAPVHVHIGSADLHGRVSLLQGTTLAPGAGALAQLVLDAPTSALYGDSFVLRDQSAQRTIGGGHVIDPRPPLRHARKPERLKRLAAFDRIDAGEALDALLDVMPRGVDLDHFALVRNLDPSGGTALLATRDVTKVVVGTVTTLFTRDGWSALVAQMLAGLQGYGEDHPDSFGATAAELLRPYPVTQRPALAAALDALLADKAVVRFGQLLQLPGHEVTLSLEEGNLWFEVAAAMRARALDPPRLSLVAEALRMGEDEIRPLLEKLARMGTLIRVSKSYFVLPDVVAGLAAAGSACARHHAERILTVGQFRETTAISRHATMPVLEFFDRVGFTRRHQDGRRIRVEPSTIFGSCDPVGMPISRLAG